MDAQEVSASAVPAWLGVKALALAFSNLLSSETRQRVGFKLRWGIGFNLWVAPLSWWVCLKFWSFRGEFGSGARPKRSLRQKGQGKEARLLSWYLNWKNTYYSSTIYTDTDIKINTAGARWSFPQKNPLRDTFCDFQRVFPMETQKVFLKEKSKKHIMCFFQVSHK